MSNEYLKSRVLAECGDMVGKGFSKPADIFVNKVWSQLYDGGYNIQSGGDMAVTLIDVYDSVPEDHWSWSVASRLLCLPEEGKQQPAQLELIWERDEVGVHGWSGHSRFVNAGAYKNIRDMKTFNWSASYNVHSERVYGNCPTLEEAIREAKQAATDLVAKHLVLPSPAMGTVKAKPIEWGEWKVPTVVGSPRYIQSKSDDGMYVVYHYETGIYMSYYYGKAIDPTHTLSGEEAQSACQTHKDRLVAELASLADFTPAPSPQPLVDALKTGIKELEGQFEIIKNLRDWLMQVEENPSVGDLLEMIGYSRSGHNERLDKYNGLILMESSLKDWEGKQ